jgi:class 3 adenylate cyclase
MDYTAVGDTTNLAARMQSLAAPGDILATKETYRLTRDYFAFTSLGKLMVKGKEEPQEAYALLRIGELHFLLTGNEAEGTPQLLKALEYFNKT